MRTQVAWMLVCIPLIGCYLWAAEPEPALPAASPAIPAPTEPAHAPTQPADLARLVAAMGDDDFASRTAAAKALADWLDRTGPAAEAQLKTFLPQPDLQATQALNKLIERAALFRQDQALFDWYDGLRLPSAHDKPYGQIGRVPDSDPWGGGPNTVQGFLLSETDDELVLLTGWRTWHILKKDPPPPPPAGNSKTDPPPDAAQTTPAPDAKSEPPAPRSFEKLNLKTTLTAALEQETPDPANQNGFAAMMIGEMYHGAGNLPVFILARNAADRGLFEQSRQLMDKLIANAAAVDAQADRHRDNNEEQAAPPANADPYAKLQRQLEADLRLNILWQSALDFNSTQFRRADLLVPLQTIADRFPATNHGQTAAELAGQLKIMIAEDEAHAKATIKPFDQMTPAEQIAELIYQLREQNGHQWSQPGECNIFDDWGGQLEGGTSPAHKLVAIGWAAVPAVIQILDDKRLTRSVGFWRNFTYSHHILRYGDCAQAILYRITGKRFYERVTTSGYLTADGREKTAKEAAEAWWAEVQKQGIDNYLIATVAKADEEACSSAQILLKRQPETGLKTVIAAAKKATNWHVRQWLVQLVAQQDKPESLRLLSEELTGEYPGTRLLAMYVLWSKDKKKEALAAALADLRQAPANKGDRVDWGDDEGVGKPNAIALCEFLLFTKELLALAGLRENFSRLAPRQQIAILQELVESSKQAEFDGAAEAFLVEALDAEGIDDGVSGNWGQAEYANPRVGDMAAQVLNLRWQLDVDFPFNGTWVERETARIQLKNRWREKHNQTALPLPAKPEIPAANPAQVQALAAALKAAGDDAAVEKALAGYRALGLSGIAPLHNALLALPANHPAQPPGEALLARLASTVRTVELAKQSAPPPQAVAEALKQMEGRPLNAKAFFAWLSQYVQQPSGHVTIVIDRPGDNTGVVIRVQTMLPQTTDAPPNNASYSTQFRLGGKCLSGLNCSTNTESLREADNWKDAIEKLEQVLSAPPATGGAADLTLRWHE